MHKNHGPTIVSGLQRIAAWTGGKHSVTLFATILFLCALLVRIYAAVYYTISTSTDVATHAMMVQHVAEGRHFPAIFYNSPYVGTLEVYVAALFDLWMPHSLLPSLLGFTLLSFLGVPAFYLFARRICGKTVALLALALLVVGPPEFFYRFHFIGYPSVFLFGMICCWLCVDLIDRAKQGYAVWLRAFLLGVAAGLGWWTNSLIVVYLIPCALVLTLGIAPRHWIPIVGHGLLGFCLGASPWILYAVAQHEALQFVTDVSSSRSLAYKLRLAITMTQELMQFAFSLDKPLRTAATLAWTLPLLGTVLYACKRVWGQRKHITSLDVRYLLPWCIILANIVICAMSGRFVHVPASRYMLPLYPAVALLAAHGIHMFYVNHARIGRCLAIACLSIILAGQWIQIPNYWSASYQERRATRETTIEQLAAFAKEHNIQAYYGDFFDQWLSFATAETMTITSFPNTFDRYRPYRDAVILNPDMGVLNRYFGVEHFIHATDATAQSHDVGGYRIHWNLLPTNAQIEVVPLEAISTAAWNTGEDAFALFRQNLDDPISWGHLRNQRFEHGEKTLHVRLSSPHALAGLRAWGPSGTWGAVTQVEVATPHDTRHVVFSEKPFEDWFWSEQYPFLAGPLARFEARFEPIQATEVWITVPAVMEYGWPLVTEIQLLEAATADAAPQLRDNHLDMLAGAIVAEATHHQPSWIYTPRAVAERLRRSDPHLPTILPSDLYEQYEGVDRYPQRPLVRMETLDGAFLVVPLADISRNKHLLAEQGWTLDVIRDVDSYAIVQVRAQAPYPTKHMYWTENGTFAAAHYFAATDDDTPKDVQVFSGNIRFGRGPHRQLIAVSFSDDTRSPGDNIAVQLQWHCAAHLNPREWAVFLHFVQDGDIRFQGDHVWLYDLSLDAIATQPENWRFVSEVDIPIPKDIPAGTYNLHMGLYHRVTGERLRPRIEETTQGAPEHQKRFVLFPAVLQVRVPE